MKIAIYGSRRLSAQTQSIERFLKELKSRGISAVMHAKLFDHLSLSLPGMREYVSEVVADSDFDADMAVSLGGDGTMLRTAVWVAGKNIPVVGFNAGHLGFLTAGPIEELPALLDDLAADRFVAERRMMLEVTSPALPEWCSPYALNEVALGKVENSSMITARVILDGTPLADYCADGLIVCTATGSTAYNLSVGGPIVEPTMEVCVISPVAAHSLSMRPMVVGGSSAIRLEPSARAPHVRLSLDSRSLEIDSHTPVEIRRSPFPALLLRRIDRPFADTLRTKLHWGD